MVLTCREYAQLVRERIESLGLSVEPLHLSPTVSLAEALENAARRGLMYTIIITSQHEAHRSVTLTILHGRNPQGFLMTGCKFFSFFKLCLCTFLCTFQQ